MSAWPFKICHHKILTHIFTQQNSFGLRTKPAPLKTHSDLIFMNLVTLVLEMLLRVIPLGL